MDISPTLSRSSSQEALHLPVVLQVIKTDEDARIILEMHGKEAGSAPLLLKFLTPAKNLFDEQANRDEFFYVLKVSREIASKLSRDEVSSMSIACAAINGLYVKHQTQLDQAWGDGRIEELLPQQSAKSDPLLGRGAPEFVSQGQFINDVESTDVSTFERLLSATMEDEQFDFHAAGLNGHGDRIKAIYDAEDMTQITKDDYDVFQAVFTSLKDAPEDTIEGQIFLAIFDIWEQLHEAKCIPFTFKQATALNELFGEHKIPNLTETFSMLQLPENFFQRYKIEFYKDLVIGLFDGDPASKIHENASSAKDIVAAVLKGASKDTPEAKLRDRIALINPVQKDSEGMGLGKVIVMGAAAVLTLYLANRFVLQPAWQWYRGRNVQVQK